MIHHTFLHMLVAHAYTVYPAGFLRDNIPGFTACQQTSNAMQRDWTYSVIEPGRGYQDPLHVLCKMTCRHQGTPRAQERQAADQ